MANSFILICTAFVTFAVANANSSGLRQGRLEDNAAAEGADKEHKQHSLLLQDVQQAVDQHLVICNAYASEKSLDILTVRTRKTLTADGPLAYKECKEFTVPLEEGDQLDFKAGNMDVGTFYATGLPKSSASLLLIPHRRSPHAVGVSFESHAFADLKNPQIAVIDAFRSKSGKPNGKVAIIENVPASGEKEASKVEEDLNFNSVVAVNAGKYEISLTSNGGGQVAKMPLQADGGVKYVVMRLGVEEDGGKGKYPQELIVFPNNGASRFAQASFAMIFAVLALLRL